MSDPIATLKITQQYRPVTGRTKEALVAWLRQMAEEMEAGQHWDSQLLTLEPAPKRELNTRFRSTNGFLKGV